MFCSLYLGTLVYYDVFAQGINNILSCNKTEKQMFELDFSSLKVSKNWKWPKTLFKTFPVNKIKTKQERKNTQKKNNKVNNFSNYFSD